jgi:hypothetical protein
MISTRIALPVRLAQTQFLGTLGDPLAKAIFL